MAQAQGMFKQLAYKKQAAKGTEETGAGGQLLRRETATLSTDKDVFSSNEITSHQQYTGDTYGVKRQAGTINGLLSPATYSSFLGSILRSDFAAVSNITGLSVTIAASGSNYTVTRGSGSFLTDGVYVGDVVRLAAAGLDAANASKNLLVLGVTATVLTVRVVNGSSMTAEGPIASTTLSFPGQQSAAAATSHTTDFYTFEEWFSDISISRRKYDVQVGRADISLPSTGNSTIALSLMGLNDASGTSQSLTSPSAETTTPILTGVNGLLVVGGTVVAIATGASISIDGQYQYGEAVIASKVLGDIVKGDLRATGQLTALFEDATLSDNFDNETPVSLIFLVTDNADADAEFVSIVLPRVKLTSATPDDGKKQIVQTFNFSAERNGTGGTGTEDRDAIVVIQDSAVA